MTLQLEIPNQLGWQERSRAFKRLNDLFNEEGSTYTLFRYHEERLFEPKYEKLNTKEDRLYVCEGDLIRCLSDLTIYDFNKHLFSESPNGGLTLKLTKTAFPRKDIIRHPEKNIVEGSFYQIDKETFDKMPFSKPPTPGRRVTITDAVDNFIRTHLRPLTCKGDVYELMYTPIIKDDEIETFVPKDVHPKAFSLAKKYQLNNFEFNILNYFYTMNKSLRNGVGQMYFDVKSNGIGWRHERTWVKNQLSRLMQLELVSFEILYDCRDGRYTSWYFYETGKSLSELKFDF